MGTEAQQALQKRTRALSPGGGARNVEGTRQAQQQAIQRNAKRGHVARRKPQREESRGDRYGREIGDGQVGAGYGGMGYGPTADNTPEFRKTRDRVDPSALTQQLLDKVTNPAIQNYRPEGSIWDDPEFSDLANEQGANIAIKARNLQRKINSAKRMRDIQKQAAMDANDMEALKLEGRQLEQANQMYAPPYQTTGTDPHTGLATDASGAFTGEGKQREMMGAGPQPQQQEAQMTPQDKVKLVEAYSKMLADYETPQETKDMIRKVLPQLMPQMGGTPQPAPGDQPQSAQEIRQKILEANPGADPNSEEFQALYRNALERFGLSE